jgi:hypothetical protein
VSDTLFPLCGKGLKLLVNSLPKRSTPDIQNPKETTLGVHDCGSSRNARTRQACEKETARFQGLQKCGWRLAWE